MSIIKAFRQWQSVRYDIDPTEHVKDCPWSKYERAIPLDECACACYDLGVFKAGYQAAKGRK